MLTTDWLMDNRNISNLVMAKELGIPEKDVARAYCEQCRVPGTPVPIRIKWGNCGWCEWEKICRKQERCMCESIQLWEIE